jgi:putative ABC transport system permease protein
MSYVNCFVASARDWKLNLTNMLLNIFITALRNLFKHKVISLIKLGGLAISIASFLFIFYYVYDELTYDRFHSNAARIYRITQTFITPENTQNIRFTHQKLGPFMKRSYAQVEDFVRLEDCSGMMGPDKIHEKGIVFADASILKVFSYQMIEGSERALSTQGSIVLSETLATRYFDGPALGKKILVDGTMLEVTGIIRDVPKNSDKWISAIIHGSFGGEEDKGLSFIHDTYIMLRHPDDAAAIRDALPKIAEGLHKDAGMEVRMGYDMQALTDLHFYKGVEMDNPKGNKANVMILALVAIILLGVATVNFVNLTTVSSLDRAKEIGIRKVTGAYNRQLIMQFMTESLMSVSIAALLAVLFVNLMNVFYQGISGKVIELSNDHDLFVMGGMAVILIVIITLSSYYPAHVLTSTNPVNVLKGKSHVRRSGWMQGIFTTGQFAMSTGLLLFLTVILFQMDFMQSSDLGFVKDRVIVAKAPEDSVFMARINSYKSELLRHSAIEQVSIGGFASNLGTTDPFASPLWLEVGGEKKQYIIPNISVDKSYPSLLKLKIVEGQSFDQIEGESVRGKVLVNEAFVKMSGLREVIGQKVSTYGGEGVVIGVVKDFHFRSLHNSIEPMAIMGLDEQRADARYIFIKASAADLSEIKSHWTQVFDQPIDYFFLDDFFNAQYKSDNDLRMLFVYFTLLTIVVSVSGLFGLILYNVSLRTREIGIRKVLGAGIVQLITLLSSQFFKPVLVGAFAGLSIALVFAHQWLDSFAYHISLTWVIAVIPVVSIIIMSMMIVFYRTYRSAIVNPVDVLKND